MPDALNRREEDRKWREQVDSRLAALTAGENDQNDRLDDIDERLDDYFRILRGTPGDKNDGGLEGDVRDLNRGLNALQAIMAPDSLGEGGVIKRLKNLEKKAGLEEKRSDNRWKFATTILAVAISSGLIARYLEKIEGFINPHFSLVQSSTKVSTKGSRRNGSRRHKPPVQEETPVEEESPSE